MKGKIKKMERKSGVSWKLIVDIGVDPTTGRRKQRTETFHLKSEAEDRLAELIQSVRKGTFVKPAKFTVAGWLNRWLRDYVEPSVRATTLRGYRSKIKHHIIPSIGHLSLANLRPDHIRQCQAEARQRGLSKLSTLHVHRVLSKALEDAMVAGHVGRNVASLSRPERLDPRPKVKYQPQAISIFLAEARKTRYFEVLLLDLFLGMRRSELLGLHWQDVDFEQRKVYVRRTLHFVPRQGIVIYPTKNETSARDIALSETALLLFRARRDRLDADSAALGISASADGYVFGDVTGKPLSPNTLSMATRKIAKRAGLPDVHLHALRHWAASLALANGATLKEVQEFLGHSTIRMTADVYGHLEDKAKVAHASRMEEGIRGLLEATA